MNLSNSIFYKKQIKRLWILISLIKYISLHETKTDNIYTEINNYKEIKLYKIISK